MSDIKDRKKVSEIQYSQMEKRYDLYYEKMLKAEEDLRFIEKYRKLNEQIKKEEQY